jgi:hypothetical protein
MKNTLVIILCSVVMLVAGCAPPDSHDMGMPVASFPGESPDKAQIFSRISRVLGAANISYDVALGGIAGEPARYQFFVPADKQAEAASLLKQDAAIHKYELKVY